MLNYVWLGLLVLGIGTALTTDIFDQSNNKYMNGEPLPVEIWFEDSVAVEQNGSFDGKLFVNENPSLITILIPLTRMYSNRRAYKVDKHL